MSVFSRNTKIAIDKHPGGYRVVNEQDRDDTTAGAVFSSREDALSQRRFEYAKDKGKTPRWARPRGQGDQ